ncbi:hypothetical protein MTBBW1_50021 [Desulfamplus magnetovallimortis]|uniref:Transposase n=1 Tax=Desulfamplus magnetovallimortis TaxID=1246637 RepID=A0A1W1HHP7_9BACT|nr:hypothetical protein MTBBW1_50021 [Desulfamplus magnetovallimortis]
MTLEQGNSPAKANRIRCVALFWGVQKVSLHKILIIIRNTINV